MARRLVAASLAALSVTSSSQQQIARVDARETMSLLQVALSEVNFAPLDGGDSPLDDADDPNMSLVHSDPRTPQGAGSDQDMKLLIDDHNAECKTILLTTVFGSRADPQRPRRHEVNIDYIDRYYRSVLSVPGAGVKAFIFYDTLAEETVRNYSTRNGVINFVKVDVPGMDKELGLNDLRFLVYEKEIRKHPEWETVFMTDSSDLIVLHNPCVFARKQPDKIFVCGQSSRLGDFKWITPKFEAMGGKYLEWYKAKENSDLRVLNAGILGGRRSTVLPVLAKMSKVLLDPNLAARKNGSSVKVNMAAFNYVIRKQFRAEDVVVGPPLHSKFAAYEQRSDVYFKHK